MLETLELLLKLQGIDGEILELDGQRELLPGEIEALETEKTDGAALLEEQQALIAESVKERGRHERTLEDLGAKLTGLQGKQLEIKTNEEYAALQHEIEFVRQEISETEDAVLRQLEEVEAMRAALAEAEGRAASRAGEIDEKVRGLSERLGRLDEALAVKRDERLRVAMHIEKGLLRRYEGILSSKGDIAVAPVVDGACGGCYAQLPPQRVIEVKRSNRLLECDSCGRILYWRPGERDG